MSPKHKSQPPRGICIECGNRPQMAAGMQNGFQRWKKRCVRCHRRRYEMNPGGGKGAHRRHVGLECESCGFVALHPCQLDVDHKDGDHSNNSPANLQTLCANCHRLKTMLNREGFYAFHHWTDAD
jgi:5-methylcytosine-specific restriction endonuclease McrA